MTVSSVSIWVAKIYSPIAAATPIAGAPLTLSKYMASHISWASVNSIILVSYGSIPLNNGIKLVDLIRRPELDYDKLAPIDIDRPELSDEVREEVNIYIKYEGYLSRQEKQVAQFKKLEAKIIPEDIDYSDVASLRIEARQKLSSIRPANIGQASRISGVSPADISVLLVYLETYHKN